jgi:hypothetical protein
MLRRQLESVWETSKPFPNIVSAIQRPNEKGAPGAIDRTGSL